jgi:GT2 family glycosyltransferase
MSKKLLIKYKNWFFKKQNQKMINDLTEILNQENEDCIPVFIVCYNNGVHVLNMVEQLNKYKITPIILNNATTDLETIHILNKIKESDSAHVIHSKKNLGHLIGFMDSIYTILHLVFAR